MKLRSILYTLARLLGDFSALKSEEFCLQNSSKPAKRIRNKGVGRVISKRLYKK